MIYVHYRGRQCKMVAMVKPNLLVPSLFYATIDDENIFNVV